MEATVSFRSKSQTKSAPAASTRKDARGSRVALGMVIAYAVLLGLVLLTSAPVNERVHLPVYGFDRIAFGYGGALFMFAGALMAAAGAWLISLGAIKNGTCIVLLGSAAPQVVTGSPVSLVVSIPTLIGAVAVAVMMVRARRR